MRCINYNKYIGNCLNASKILPEYLDEIRKRLPRCRFMPYFEGKKYYYYMTIIPGLIEIVYDGVIWNVTHTGDEFVWCKDMNNNGYCGSFNELIDCIMGIVDT